MFLHLLTVEVTLNDVCQEYSSIAEAANSGQARRSRVHQAPAALTARFATLIQTV